MMQSAMSVSFTYLMLLTAIIPVMLYTLLRQNSMAISFGSWNILHTKNHMVAADM